MPVEKAVSLNLRRKGVMNKYKPLLPIICIFIAAISSDVLAGQITIIKSGNSFTSFMAGNEDYKPSPIYEDGILLGDGSDNSNPIYEFILPPKTHSSGNQIDYIEVRLFGDDYTDYSKDDAYIVVGDGIYEDNIQATVAWSWSGINARDKLIDTGNESILKITLKVNELYAKYDLEKIEVTYGYSNVSSDILDVWQNLHTARKSFQEYRDVTVPTWDAVSTSINYLNDGIKQCRSYANNISNIGSGNLFNALISANSAVDDLVEIKGILSGSFSIIPWKNSYGVLEAAAGLGNYYPSGIIDNFNDVLPDINTLADNYYLYAFDGDVDFDDYDQHLEPALIGLRSGSGGMPDLKLGMDTAANIIKDIYNSQKTDIAKAMFYSLSPMYTPRIDGNDVTSTTPSYLQEFYNYIDTLVLYSAVSVPDRPVLLFPANDTFAKGLVTFHWNESATATKYHLQISLNSSFNNLIYELEESEYSTSASFTSFTDNGSTKLYWRVKTGNSSGWSLYSDYRVFTSGCMNGDFDGDCEVDIDDFAILASRWLDTGCSSFDLCQGTDMVRSGDIDFEDFAAFAQKWQETASEPLTSPPVTITLVSINDPGFNGYMSKYETTNYQYCEFLNAALASGDVIVGADNIVYGANGSNSGKDYIDKPYLETYAVSRFSQITYNGVAFSVRSRDGYYMGNHPVVEVSWYGASAFCNYYGYRLPTELEWREVANFNGSYTYGCGTAIDHSKANYDYDNPLNLTSTPYTTPVNYYSSWGYGMNDMAGNVWEWTSTFTGIYLVFCGGSWNNTNDWCAVSSQGSNSPYLMGYRWGFRVCR